MGRALEEILARLERMDLGERPEPTVYADLNTREVWRDVRPDRVDLVEFYERIHRLWRPNSIGFDDTCIAYKDRQYVTQRPSRDIRFFSNNDGSAMGAGFGLGVGAKVADPSLHTFVFTGDGCWRLFGGALADAQHLDLRVFIVNNGTYGIVDKGLEVVVPDVPKRRYHSRLREIDFVAAAKAHGWDAVRLAPDLSDLDDVMAACYERRGRSMLIDLPVDPDQVVGLNPRLYNLKTTTYL
jgi:acetolactate synthase-1/2/3 large subunit